jgi:hypothetical protein
MALIKGSTPIWRDEKSFVKDMLQEPFSSRPVDCVAGTVGTNRRLLEDSHDKPLAVLAGSNTIHPNLPRVAMTHREWRGQGTRRSERPQNGAWHNERNAPRVRNDGRRDRRKPADRYACRKIAPPEGRLLLHVATGKERACSYGVSR